MSAVGPSLASCVPFTEWLALQDHAVKKCH